MPNDFPPSAAVYQQSQRWLAAGCFETLAQDLRALLRRASGRAEEPTAAIIDSRTLRSTPESGTRAGDDGAKRKRGSKVHMAVDTLGHLLALHVTPADIGDRAAMKRSWMQLAAASGSPMSIRATPARQPQIPLRLKASRCMSSSCRKQSVALSCCPDAGSSNDPSPGPHAAAGWSKTTSDMPKPWRASMSSPSSDTCSAMPLN